MSKVILSVADKLKQMKQIPENLLPSTLKHKILLPKID